MKNATKICLKILVKICKIYKNAGLTGRPFPPCGRGVSYIMYINAQNFGHYTLIMYTYMHGLVHYCTMKARSYNHFRDVLKMLYFYIFIFLYKKEAPFLYLTTKVALLTAMLYEPDGTISNYIPFLCTLRFFSYLCIPKSFDHMIIFGWRVYLAVTLQFLLS